MAKDLRAIVSDIDELPTLPQVVTMLLSLMDDPESSAEDVNQVLERDPALVSKILKLLTRAGLLTSHRGVHGGYELARDPKEISVSTMIEALEGPIAMTACVDEINGQCEHIGSCSTQGNWLTINRAIREVLENISLADMVRGVDPKGVLTPASLGGSCGSETDRDEPRPRPKTEK